MIVCRRIAPYAWRQCSECVPSVIYKIARNLIKCRRCVGRNRSWNGALNRAHYIGSLERTLGIPLISPFPQHKYSTQWYIYRWVAQGARRTHTLMPPQQSDGLSAGLWPFAHFMNLERFHKYVKWIGPAAGMFASHFFHLPHSLDVRRLCSHSFW